MRWAPRQRDTGRTTKGAHVSDTIDDALAIILVEGISDQIAVETLALRHGRDLVAERITVLPAGGAQAMAPYLHRFGPLEADLNVVGLCDADAVDTVMHELGSAGFGRPGNTTQMAALGFHVCVDDLEDELIRAAGPDLVLAQLEANQDLKPFRTFQKQPAWRDRPVEAQLRRFFGSKARRSLRYAKTLVDAIPLAAIPEPISAVLADA